MPAHHLSPHAGPAGWPDRAARGWISAGHAQHRSRHEHEGRRGQVHARARYRRDAFGRVPQERADHQFGLAGQRQRHAAVGRQPAPAAVGRARPSSICWWPASSTTWRSTGRASSFGGVSDVDEARTVYLIPSDMQLTLFEREVSKESLHARLRTSIGALLNHVRGVFDVVLIDCPPGLSVLTESLAARGRLPFLADQARLCLDLRAGGVPPFQGPRPGDGLCREPRRRSSI